METILVTGGTGKLGRVLVKYLLQRGYHVVYTSTSDRNLASFHADLGSLNNEAIGIIAELSQASGVDKLLHELQTRSISVHHLVNNARRTDTLVVEDDGTTKRKNFIAEFELDVVVPYELCVGLAGTSESALKTVINIGSQYGLVSPNPALYGGTLAASPIQYGVAKAALVHLTKELAVRMADQGIRVNCIAYGGVEGRVDQAFVDRYAQLVPSRRMLTEAEFPGPVAFLLSDASTAVTGQVIVADGGWTAW